MSKASHENLVTEESIGNRSPFHNVKMRYFLLWITIGFIVLYFSLKLIVNGLMGLSEFTFKYSVASLIYVYVFLLCLKVTKKNHIKFKNIFTIKDKKINWLEIIGLTILTKVIYLTTLSTALLYFVYANPQYLNDFTSNMNTAVLPLKKFVLLAFLSVVIAPLIEELFFRGIVLQAWAVRWGLKRGIIFSSLVFAALHFSPQFLDIFLGGIILSVLFIKYQSLLVPIVFHVINNSIVQVTSFFNRGASSSDSLTLDQAKAEGWTALILLVISASIFIVYLKKSQLKGRLPVI